MSPHARWGGLGWLFAALLALTYIDLDHWLLPRSITVPFIALGLLASLLPGGPGLASSALGAAVGFAALALLGFLAERILKKEALGGGDVWLLSMIGAWLGLASLLPVVLLASLQGAVVGGLLASTTLTLFVVPVLYTLFFRDRAPEQEVIRDQSSVISEEQTRH